MPLLPPVRYYVPFEEADDSNDLEEELEPYHPRPLPLSPPYSPAQPSPPPTSPMMLPTSPSYDDHADNTTDSFTFTSSAATDDYYFDDDAMDEEQPDEPETHRSTATATSKHSSPSPSSSSAPLPWIGNDSSSSRFDLWFHRYEAGGGAHARIERWFGRRCVGGQERSRRG